MSSQGSSGNIIAAVCSFFIPGLGQLVQGNIGKAIMFFVITAVSYALVATVILFFMWVVAVGFHIWSIYDAATN